MVLQVRRFVVRSLSGCEGHNLFTCAFENAVRLYRLIRYNAISLGNKKTKQLKKACWLLHWKKKPSPQRMCWRRVTFVHSVFSHSLVHCMSCTVAFSAKKKTKSKRVLSGWNHGNGLLSPFNCLPPAWMWSSRQEDILFFLLIHTLLGIVS